MERRLAKTIDIEVQTMNERLRTLSSSRNSRLATREKIGNRYSLIENRLKLIAESVGITVQANAGDDNEDRKRLKEKLKEALELKQKEHSLQNKEKEPWMEYVFGICKADGRVGNGGSRYVILASTLQADRTSYVMYVRLIHPQSRFMQGVIEFSLYEVPFQLCSIGHILLTRVIFCAVQLC
jgi:hypothetical protein